MLFRRIKSCYWSAETEAKHADFQRTKAEARERLEQTQASLGERLAMLSGLGLALFPAPAARILRAAEEAARGVDGGVS